MILKKLIFLFCFTAFFTRIAFCTTVTITSSGFTFSPDSVKINFGDTIIFQISGSHNAIEVSQQTWNANGNSPLPGFSTPFGGGQITGLTVGTHYYVCSPHASSSMKGRIFVSQTAGLNDNEESRENIIIYPNPTNGMFFIQFQSTPAISGKGISKNPEINLEIYNMYGEKIYSISNFSFQNAKEINTLSFEKGFYLVRLLADDGTKKYVGKIVAQ